MIVAAIVAEHGINGLFLCTIMAGSAAAVVWLALPSLSGREQAARDMAIMKMTRGPRRMFMQGSCRSIFRRAVAAS